MGELIASNNVDFLFWLRCSHVTYSTLGGRCPAQFNSIAMEENAKYPLSHHAK